MRRCTRRVSGDGRGRTRSSLITEPVKSQRLQMVDEIKRALEIAEMIPFRYLIQHIGVSGEEFDERKVDAAFTALEELSICSRGSAASRSCWRTFRTTFPAPSGCSHFLEADASGPWTSVFDVGHAHMSEGVEAAFGIMKERIRSTHVHDNNGKEDKHLFPFLAERRDGRLERHHAACCVRGRRPVSAGAGAEGSGESWRIRWTRVKEMFDRLESIRDQTERISGFAKTPRSTSAKRSEIAGMALQPAQVRQDRVPTAARRHRHHAVRGGEERAPGERCSKTIKNLTQESSLIVTRQDARGTARAGRLRNGRRERWRWCSAIPESDPYPITPKEHGIDFLMDHRHLWLRSQRQHAILRVRHEIIKAVRDYFDSHGFTLVDTPIFTPAACEGTTTLFEVNYFEDEKAYLTQSGPALQRSHGDGVRQGLLLRSDVPRRKIQDAPPPDRVLDGGAGDGLRDAGRREARGRGAGRLRGGARAGEAARRAEATGARRRASSKRSRRRSRASATTMR